MQIPAQAVYFSMEIEIGVFFGLLAAVLNLVLCSFMLRMEGKMIRDGRLPLKGILCMRDRNFYIYRNFICVTIIDFAILYVLVREWPPSIYAVLISVLMAGVWTVIWHSIWLSPRHMPNSFYPRAGVVSLLGKVHLLYFAVQYFLGFLGLWMVGYMMVGLRPWLWVVVVSGLFAAGVYFSTLGWDFLTYGKFKKLPSPRD